MLTTHTDYPSIVKSWKNRVVEAYSLLSFICDRYSRGFVVSENPALDEEGLRFFKSIIATTSVYLEYGSGGSTLFASQHANLLVTVESDRLFLDAVQKKLDRLSMRSTLQPIYVDIGFTKLWGKPVFTKPTERRLRRWKKYASAPWEFFRRQAIEPDTILVDGRFRVACALQSLLNLGKTNSCKILVDDYVGNAHYRPIEQFGDLIEMHGRMAVFRKRSSVDDAACREALEHFYIDFR
jgi:hypothetical protein